MTTNLPVLDSTMHPASVTYLCKFAPTITGGGLVMFAVPAPVQWLFTFDTGQTQPDPDVDLWNITSDASWFDQTAQEASIKTMLDGICALIATGVGTTQAAMQATVSVQRTWRYNPNQVGTAAPVQVPSAPVPYTEVMAYP